MTPASTLGMGQISIFHWGTARAYRFAPCAIHDTTDLDVSMLELLRNRERGVVFGEIAGACRPTVFRRNNGHIATRHSIRRCSLLRPRSS